MQPDQAKLDELVRRIVEAVHPLRIILFGSAARGDWTEDSDVDVLVLLDTVPAADRQCLAQRACELGVLDSGILLQAMPMTTRDFSELLSHERRFALDVEREGIVL